MGQSILKLYKARVKKGWRLAALWVFVFGLAAHAYKFLNTLPNNDSLFHVYSDMNMTESGRWFLSVACAPSTIADLPWLNGLLCLLYIAVTAAIITDIFKLENPVQIALISGLLVTFPCVTDTFFYEFTADGYMLAMLFASLAVRLTVMDGAKPWRTAAAAALICLCCGIYQAYVSFALLLAAVYFIWEILTGQRDNALLRRWCIRMLAVFALGLAAYLVIWKVILAVTGISVVNYAGIDEVGLVDSSVITGAIAKSLRTVLMFFLYWNVFEHGLTLYAAMNLIMLALTAVLLIIAVLKTKLYKRPGRLALIIVTLAVLPFAACMWYFSSPNVMYHYLMLQSLVLIYVLALVLAERFFTPRWSTAAAALALLLVLKYTAQANICYFEMDKCYESSKATGIEILARVHALDDGSVERIAIIGDRNTSLAALNAPEIAEIFGNAAHLKPNLITSNGFGMSFIYGFLGSDYQLVSDEEYEALENSTEVEAMSLWPLRDSVRIIGGTAVIKLPDTAVYE